MPGAASFIWFIKIYSDYRSSGLLETRTYPMMAAYHHRLPFLYIRGSGIGGLTTVPAEAMLDACQLSWVVNCWR